MRSAVLTRVEEVEYTHERTECIEQHQRGFRCLNKPKESHQKTKKQVWHSALINFRTFDRMWRGTDSVKSRLECIGYRCRFTLYSTRSTTLMNKTAALGHYSIWELANVLWIVDDMASETPLLEVGDAHICSSCFTYYMSRASMPKKVTSHARCDFHIET